MNTKRRELLAYLGELGSADPRVIWRAEREQGLVSGIDQVFHFFFDDSAFTEDDVGSVFHNRRELANIDQLKHTLQTILNAVGDEGDDMFVQHPLWKEVRNAAVEAIRSFGNSSR